MPRSFTPLELTETITLDDYWAMSEADRLAFDLALTALWLANPSTADWRKIEAVLERVFRSYCWELDHDSESGDLVNDDINLTLLAKDLARELAP